MNFVLLTGRLGQDPQVTNFETGKVANFSLATNENYKNRDGVTVEKTEWHKVVVGNKLAENCEKYLSKGHLVSVQGKLQTRSYEKDGQTHYVTEVRAVKVEFLEKKADNVQPVEAAIVKDEQEDDDLPF